MTMTSIEAGAAWSDRQRGRSGVRPFMRARQRASDRTSGGVPSSRPTRGGSFRPTWTRSCRGPGITRATAADTTVERFGRRLVTRSPRRPERLGIWNLDDALPSIAPQSRPSRKDVIAPHRGVIMRVPQQRADVGEPQTRREGRRLDSPPSNRRRRSCSGPRCLTPGSGWRSARGFGIVSRALRGVYAPDGEPGGHAVAHGLPHRSEKVLSQGGWLQALHVARDAAHGPANRCLARDRGGAVRVRHPRLDDRNYSKTSPQAWTSTPRQSDSPAKMHPLQYQRPQAPTAGTIAAAEKIVATLGPPVPSPAASAGSTGRRAVAPEWSLRRSRQRGLRSPGTKAEVHRRRWRRP